jgi:hypothetical protein
MHKVCGCILLGLAASLGGHARADDTPAAAKRTLEKDCQAWASWVDGGFKAGSLKNDAMRCVDTMNGYREMGAAIGGVWCAPADLTTAQAIRAFLKYVQEHPSTDPDETGAALALRAFKAAYPCGLPAAPQ